tara:strand:+ start:244 stop:789 length:546 start_codon:yes stop_codon:yes gene_type:complete
MATPSTGQFSFSQIQSVLGGSNPVSLSEYYKGAVIIPTAMGGASTIPASGAIGMSDLRNKPVTLSYTQGTSPLSAGNAQTWGSGSLNLSLYLPLGELEVGDTFKIVTYPTAGSFWAYQADFVSTFTYGTAATFQSPSTGGKSTYRQTIYNGSNGISMYGFYSGGETNYKESGAYIKEIRYE